MKKKNEVFEKWATEYYTCRSLHSLEDVKEAWEESAQHNKKEIIEKVLNIIRSHADNGVAHENIRLAIEEIKNLK